jgi:hypothetical protein
MANLKDTPENRIKLGRTVAELTQEKPWKCNWHPGLNDGVAWCKKCDYRNPSGFDDHECTKPDPIAIDDSDECMGLAVRMFRELQVHYNTLYHIDSVRDLFYEAIKDKGYISFESWLLHIASAFEIFQIIAKAKQKT